MTNVEVNHNYPDLRRKFTQMMIATIRDSTCEVLGITPEKFDQLAYHNLFNIPCRVQRTPCHPMIDPQEKVQVEVAFAILRAARYRIEQPMIHDTYTAWIEFPDVKFPHDRHSTIR